jgi:WD40 repeat protein
LSGEEIEGRKGSGPRLISCSDDKTIRVWRKRPRAKAEVAPTGQGKVPSIWKRTDFEEDWYEEAVLPQVHERPVYAANWSKKTGRVVSTGSDGKIVVYEERATSKDVEMSDADAVNGLSTTSSPTEWVVIATYENGHDVFEINHAVWAPRVDKGRRGELEEIIITTGDDGDVKAWTLDD